MQREREREDHRTRLEKGEWIHIYMNMSSDLI